MGPADLTHHNHDLKYQVERWPHLNMPEAEDLIEDRIIAEPALQVGPVDFAPAADEDRRHPEG